ncbi:MAG TPA: type II CAAX endopeptidase family protein [Candidatus Acidoferrum sp.]|nr:type II CAAX endopeptidase family protein [Candidatus Acidoferrum sp.]
MPSSKKARRKKTGERWKYIIYAALLASIIAITYLSHLYSSGAISENTLLVYGSIAQSMFFSLAVFSFMLIRGNSIGKMTAKLGISRRSFKPIHIAYGVIIFLAILALEFGLAYFQQVTGIQLPTNVAAIFGGLPDWFLLFSVFIAPLNEEVLFRGFLVPEWWIRLRRHSRAWAVLFILFSASFFGLLHYLSYNSISEFLAAFVFGLIAGAVRLKTRSLYPSITAHIIVNLFGLIVVGG